MVPVDMVVLATMQAQIDETMDRLGETQARVDDLAQACWELATAVEWLLEELARPGIGRDRVLARVGVAIDVFEDGGSNG